MPFNKGEESERPSKHFLMLEMHETIVYLTLYGFASIFSFQCSSRGIEFHVHVFTGVFYFAPGSTPSALLDFVDTNGGDVLGGLKGFITSAGGDIFYRGRKESLFFYGRKPLFLLRNFLGEWRKTVWRYCGRGLDIENRSWRCIHAACNVSLHTTNSCG